MFLFASLMGITMFRACKKDDSESVKSKDVPKTLMAKKWRATDYQYTYEGKTVNAFAVRKDCENDNTLEFKSGGIAEEITYTKCYPSEQDTINFKWELRNNNKELRTIDLNSVSGTKALILEIVTINDKVLKLRYVTTEQGKPFESLSTFAPLQ